MEIGRVLHRTFEHWLQGHATSEIMLHFEEAWRGEVGEGLPPQERLHPGNVRLVLEHWLLAQEGRVREFETVKSEEMFEVPLGKVAGEEVMFYGTIDGLIDWKGERWLLEHKTTGNMDAGWQASWGMKAQLQGYVWALRQCGHDVKGAFVNGLEVRKLPPWDGNYAKKCGQHKVKYQECQGLHVKHAWVGPLWWSEARLEQWRRDGLAGAEKLLWLRDDVNVAGVLDEVRMDGQFKWPGCQRCPYQAWCNAGRPLVGLEQMMVHAAWREEESGENSDV